MSGTAVHFDTILDLATTADDAPSCELMNRETPCDNEAVFIVRYAGPREWPTEISCRCGRTGLICLSDYDRITQERGGVLACARCDRAMQIVHAEPVRR